MAKQNRRALGNDPLFNPEGFHKKTNSNRAASGSSPVVSEEAVQQVGKVYKELKKALRSERGSQKKKEDSGEFTRMTFIVRRAQLDQLRHHAQQKGITVKEALGEALAKFFEPQKDKAKEGSDLELLKAFHSADEKTRKVIKLLLEPSSQK